MADISWIKLSTDIFNNRKIRQIESMPDGDVLLVIWLKLLVLAGNINDGGLVYFCKDIPYTDQLLATEFGKPISTIQLALATFERFGMIEVIDELIMVSNWEKYQNVDGLEKVREQNRLRQARFRNNQTALLESGVAHNVTRNVTVTPSNATDIDKEIDIDINNAQMRTSEEDESSDFETFWSAYPKKKDKKRAKASFLRAAKSKDFPKIDELLSILEKQMRSRQWQEKGGQFIPYPSSWLNGERWNDEMDDRTIDGRVYVDISDPHSYDDDLDESEMLNEWN